MKYYTVYLKETDEIVASGNAKNCAKQMGTSLASFQCLVSRVNRGIRQKYEVLIEDIRPGEELDDEDEDDGDF